MNELFCVSQSKLFLTYSAADTIAEPLYCVFNCMFKNSTGLTNFAHHPQKSGLA